MERSRQLILPPSGTPLRERLDVWFVRNRLEICVRAEVEEAGLLRALGGAGRGVFPARAALSAKVEDRGPA
ncbi:MAG: hypothetical protein JW940_04570 [Polyangiaceae bacterium]|nr:hypothetical protein [Polyangiaceae bacterium]